jgi:membrane-associated phospholipid phosphatase
MFNPYFVTTLLVSIAFGFFHLDQEIITFIKKLRKKIDPAGHYIFQAISFTPFVFLSLYAIPATCVFFFLDFLSVIALTLACILSTGLAFVGKYIFKRVRPMGHLTYLGKIDSAFPSAHSAGSFAAAFILAFFWPTLSIPFFILASLVAISRIYLELHFFSDVIGGILLAYLMTIFILDSQIIIFISSFF